jgi:hypothetical protein
MKSFSLLILLLVSTGQRSFAQTGAERLRTYRTTIATLTAADYQVQRIDTFGDGNVWNHTGHVVL